MADYQSHIMGLSCTKEGGSLCNGKNVQITKGVDVVTQALKEVAVSFERAFTAAPVVFTMAANPASGQRPPYPKDVTSQGFTLCFDGITADESVTWLAIGTVS